MKLHNNFFRLTFLLLFLAFSFMVVDYSWGYGNPDEDQGVCPTAIITGNSSMTAGFSEEGRLVSLYHPSVGAYNHVYYKTKKSQDIASDDYFLGARSWDGSFPGIRIDNTNKVYWLSDKDWKQEPSYIYE